MSDLTVFLGMTTEDFDRTAAEILAELDKLPSREAVQAYYRETVYPFERARICRAAGEPVDLLLVTCGAQADSVTLSVDATPAQFVALLHTPDSLRSAEETIRRTGLLAHQAATVSVGDGKNQLDIYQAILRVWKERGKPVRVVVDMTGGFKCMSAAATMAGGAIPGGKTAYVDADQRRLHGELIWVNQRRIFMENPLVVFGEVERQAIQQLLQDGQWEGAATRLRVLVHGMERPEDVLQLSVVEGYAALEQMNFAVAADKLYEACGRADRYEQQLVDLRSLPAVQARAQLRQQAERLRGIDALLKSVVKSSGREVDPLSEMNALCTPAMLDLLPTLWLLAERMQARGQMDLAALLAYRVAEAALQRRLAILGVDPQTPGEGLSRWTAGQQMSLDELCQKISAMNPAKDKSYLFDPDRSVARLEAMLTLTVLDPTVKRVVSLKEFQDTGAARNRSVLAHGLRTMNKNSAERVLAEAKKLIGWAMEREGRTLETELAIHRLIPL